MSSELGYRPTREELDRLADLVAVMGPGTGTDLAQIRELLRSYPLPPEDGEVAGEEPPEDGERARLAAMLASRAAQEAEDAIEGERRGVSGPRLKIMQQRAADYAKAAALLRQPPPPPAAGVSKAEVLREIEALAGRHPNWQRLYEFVEALPEAAPHEGPSRARQQGSNSEGGLSDQTTSTKQRARAAAAFGETTAPPSGVDREADGWHYLPELPEVGVPCLLAARWRPESDAFVCFGEWTGFRWEVLEDSEAEPLLYAWRLAPEPPPLPEAKP